MAESTGFTRRHFLTVATVVTGGAGVIATAVPFVASFKPSARAQALGAPVEVDISKLEVGALREGRVARPPDLHRAPLRGDARVARARTSSLLRDPTSEELRCSRATRRTSIAASARRSSCSRASARTSVARRCRASRWRRPISARLAGRLLLPVPRLEVRSRGPRVRRRAGARRICRVPPYRFINDNTILIGSDTGNS